MGSSSLIVPIKIDALHLSTDMSLVGAPLDFTKVPFFDGERDINPDQPYLARGLKPQAFADHVFHTVAGVHLHWAMPDALTQMRIQNDQSVNYFNAPNRWLVSCFEEGKLINRWIVCSDYLYPKELSSHHLPIVAYPVNKTPLGTDKEQFRYMGKSWELKDWLKLSSDDKSKMEFLSQTKTPLTPFGYGSPDFHAFYPSCHSLFGFKDENYEKLPDGELQYKVIGWHDDPSQHDPLSLLKIEGKKNNLAKFDLDFIKQELNWAVDPTNTSLPDRTIYIGKIVLKKSTEFSDTPEYYHNNIDQARPTVSIGNTRNEALASLIADNINPSNKTLIEDQLEAVYYKEMYHHNYLDHTYKFEEVRHASGFRVRMTDREWVLKKGNTSNHTTANQANKENSKFIHKHPDVAEDLNQLNLAQLAYDKAWRKLERDRTQVYADWYKYMYTAYPDETHFLTKDWNSNDLRDYVERQILWPYLYEKDLFGPPLFWNSDKLVLQFKDPVHQANFEKVISKNKKQELAALAETISGKLMIAYRTTHLAIAEYNKTIATSDQKFWLLSVASQPFYDVLEPAIMISGQAANDHKRHGHDGDDDPEGNLKVWLDTSIDNDPVNSIKALDLLIDQKITKFNTQDRNPWNPHHIEFEVRLHSLAAGSQSVVSQANPYQVDHVTKNYELINKRPDFTPTSKSPSDSAAIILGRSLLTSGTEKNMLERIIHYLCNLHENDFIPHALSPAKAKELQGKLEQAWFPKAYMKAVKDYRGKKAAAFLQANRETLKEVFDQRPCINEQGDFNSFNNLPLEKQQKDLYFNLFEAWKKLEGFESITSVLTHFNWHLLQFQEGWQLPIEDPIGFKNTQAFTAAVKDAVGDGTKLAPRFMESGFTPIREGLLQFQNLRIVDTFGQPLDVNHLHHTTGNSISIPKDSNIPQDKDTIQGLLRPRLCQPARKNFNWLTAQWPDQIVNDHPDATPICGWLIHNYVESSVMVYSADGLHWGSLQYYEKDITSKIFDVRWQPAPGHNTYPYPDAFPNKSLTQVTEFLLAQGGPFFKDFMKCLDTALDSIDPENHSEHDGMAFLISRPMAVVRATLKLELLGAPAIEQSLETFQKEFKEGTAPTQRDNGGILNVQFPIRIGEFQQLNDGLVGYWIEGEQGLSIKGKAKLGLDTEIKGLTTEHTYFAPQALDPTHPETNIKTHKQDLSTPLVVHKQLDEPATQLTLLMDPRGSIHATSGILPTKNLHLQPHHFTEVLKKMEATFLTAPLITSKNELQFPVNQISGKLWTWLDKPDGALKWRSSDKIAATKQQADFDESVIREGWLRLTDNE